MANKIYINTDITDGAAVWERIALHSEIFSVTRVDTTYSVLATDYNIFCDTDGGAFTITLPAGADGRKLRITNVGSSGNALTVDGDGVETVYGDATQTLYDGEVLDMVYDTTEGWY